MTFCRAAICQDRRRARIFRVRACRDVGVLCRVPSFALLALAAAPACVSGQQASGALQGAFDVGSAVLRQPGLPGSAVWTAGSQLGYTGDRATLTSNALAALTPDARWTAQGVLSGSLFAPAFQRRRWELAATANAFGLTSEPPTWSGQLLAREHFLFSSYGVYLGAGGGTVVQEARWHSATLAQLGAYARVGATGRDVLSAGMTFTDTRREVRAIQQNGSIVRSAPAATYTDLSGYWQRERVRSDLLAGAGLRIGMRGTEAASPWLSLSATYWLTPRVGVVAAAGRALEDVVRGVPSARYASLALRLAIAGRAPNAIAPGHRGIVSADDGRPRVTIAPAEDAACLLTIHVAHATSVEVMGDFTGWEALPLTHDSTSADAWTLVHPITPGIHRIAVRLDSTTWIPPANLPQATDEFGALIGLLAVPR